MSPPASSSLLSFLLNLQDHFRTVFRTTSKTMGLGTTKMVHERSQNLFYRHVWFLVYVRMSDSRRSWSGGRHLCGNEMRGRPAVNEADEGRGEAGVVESKQQGAEECVQRVGGRGPGEPWNTDQTISPNSTTNLLKHLVF